MENLEEIYARIQKLIRLSTSSNVNEAAVASAKAAELMLRYQINTMELEDFDLPKKEPVDIFWFEEDSGSKNKNSFKASLTNEIANFFGCKVIWKGPRLEFIGRKSDLDASRYLFNVIFNQIESLTEYTWATNGILTGVHGKTWKNSFRIGALSCISARLKEQKASSMESFKASNSRALVVLSELELAVKQRMATMHLRSAAKTHHNLSNHAYSAGKTAASTINLGGNASLSGHHGNLNSPNLGLGFKR